MLNANQFKNFFSKLNKVESTTNNKKSIDINKFILMLDIPKLFYFLEAAQLKKIQPLDDKNRDKVDHLQLLAYENSLTFLKYMESNQGITYKFKENLSIHRIILAFCVWENIKDVKLTQITEDSDLMVKKFNKSLDRFEDILKLPEPFRDKLQTQIYENMLGHVARYQLTILKV